MDKVAEFLLGGGTQSEDQAAEDYARNVAYFGLLKNAGLASAQANAALRSSAAKSFGGLMQGGPLPKKLSLRAVNEAVANTARQASGSAFKGRVSPPVAAPAQVPAALVTAKVRAAVKGANKKALKVSPNSAIKQPSAGPKSTLSLEKKSSILGFLGRTGAKVTKATAGAAGAVEKTAPHMAAFLEAQRAGAAAGRKGFIGRKLSGMSQAFRSAPNRRAYAASRDLNMSLQGLSPSAAAKYEQLTAAPGDAVVSGLKRIAGGVSGSKARAAQHAAELAAANRRAMLMAGGAGLGGAALASSMSRS